MFLDASKAFDRVKYSKIFLCLLNRKLPAVFIRLLLSLYAGHVACVLWNGVYSGQFPVLNGVKQGGILSPVLLCVYIDGLLDRLAKCHVGCYIGLNFLGALAYADDIVLLLLLLQFVSCCIYVMIMHVNILLFLMGKNLSVFSFLALKRSVMGPQPTCYLLCKLAAWT